MAPQIWARTAIEDGGFAIVAKTFAFLVLLVQFYDFNTFDWFFWYSSMISLDFYEKVKLRLVKPMCSMEKICFTKQNLTFY